jgi:hypothetical protein
MAKKIDKIYSWNINSLDTHVSHEGEVDVVHTIHWTYKCTEGDISSSMIGTYSPEYDKKDFIEYKKLTKENVITWLELNLDVENMKTLLNNNIAIQKTPVSNSYNDPCGSE